jgi:hypothetical protein
MAPEIPSPDNNKGRSINDGAVPLDLVLTGSVGTADLQKVNEEVLQFRSNPNNLQPITKILLSKQVNLHDKPKGTLPPFEINPAIDSNHDGFATGQEIDQYVRMQRSQRPVDKGDVPPPMPPVPGKAVAGGQSMQAAIAVPGAAPDEKEAALDRLNRKSTQFDIANLGADPDDPLGNKGLSSIDALRADALFDALQGLKLLEFNYPHLNSTDTSKLKHLDSLSVVDEIKPLLQKGLTTEAKAWLSAAQPYIDALGKDSITRDDLKKLIDILSPKVELIHGSQVHPMSGLMQIPGMPSPPGPHIFPSPGMPSLPVPRGAIPNTPEVEPEVPDDNPLSPEHQRRIRESQRLT